MPSRYVHPDGDAVLDAMWRLGGHKTGHNEHLVNDSEEPPAGYLAEGKRMNGGQCVTRTRDLLLVRQAL
jgi:hypothetical protein